jgi:fibronectin-binding autotransporter adhesin
MRRPPFQVNPLALSVALLLVTPVAAFAQDTPLTTNSSTTITNPIVVVSGAGAITTNGADNITQVTANVSGTGKLVKQGTGTLSLTADNGYSGGTDLLQGTLAISRDAGLGTGGLNIASGAVLQTNKAVNINVDVVLNGAAHINTNGNNSKLTGAVSGNILVKEGDGSLTVDNVNNSYTGGTLINGGSLIIKNEASLGAPSASTGVAIQNGTLQFAEDMTLNQKIYTAGVSGGSINTAGHDVVLAGKIVDDVNILGQTYTNGRLVKSGAGKLTLTQDSEYDLGTDAGGNTLSGSTVINGGVLSVAKDSYLGAAVGVINAGEQEVWKKGNLVIDGGTLEATATLDSDRFINIGYAGATIDVSGASNTTTLRGLITKDASVGGNSDGGLVKEGDGTLRISLQSSKYLGKSDGTTAPSTVIPTNLYEGKTVVKAGVLEIDSIAKDLGGARGGLELAGGDLKLNQTSVLATQLTLTGDGGAIDSSGGSSVIQGKITGDGGLAKKGSGTLILQNASSDYKGDTTISEGKLQVSASEALGASNSGKLVLDGGVLQVTNGAAQSAMILARNAVITANNGTIDTTSQNVELSGNISGEGQLIKSGSGTFKITGDNTFEGGVRIKEGTLEVKSDNSLGKSGGDVIIDGATLGITGGTDTTLTRKIILTQSGGTVSVTNATAELAGEIALAQGVSAADLTKAGAGNLDLTGDNTAFNGNIIVKDGSLGITAQNNLANGKLFLDGGNIRTNGNIANFNKDIVINSQGGVDTNGHTSTVTGVIQGEGAFVKGGVGTLTLSGDNAYSGGTLIKGGVLAVSQHKNLGSTKTNITLDGGGLLIVDHLDPITGQIDNLNFNIGELADGRAIVVNSGNGSLDTNGHNSTISSAITGAGVFTKKGDGTLTLTANNGGLTGGITVEGGILSVNKDENLGTSNALLTLNGSTLLTTDNLILNRQIVLGTNNATLDQGANNVTMSKVVSGEGALTKNGAGILTLDGVNTFKGGTNINAGQVTVSQNSSLGLGDVNFAAGTQLNTSANVSLANKMFLAGTAAFDTATNTQTALTGVLSDIVGNPTVGYLVKQGDGALALNTANTYSGGTDVNKGTVIVGANAALGTGAVNFANATTLATSAKVTISNQMQLKGATTFSTAVDAQQQDNALVVAGSISGMGSVTKVGAGSVSFNGSNTYSGGTTVSAGKAIVTKDASFGTGSVVLAAGTTLEAGAKVNLANTIQVIGDGNANTTNDVVTLSANQGNDSTVSGVISGDAGLVKVGDGILTLTNNNSYSGGTTIKGGALAITSGSNLGTTGTNVTLDGGDLQLLANLNIGVKGDGSSITVAGLRGAIDTNGHDSTMGSVLQGAGVFVKKGTGTLTLDQAGGNLLTGGVTIEGGTLSIDRDGSLGTSTSTLTLDGGVLSVSDDITLARTLSVGSANGTIKTASNININQSVTGVGELTLEGGRFTLAGNNSHQGGTTVLDSTLTIGSDANLGAVTGMLTLENGTLQTIGNINAVRNVALNGAVNILDTDVNAVTLNGVISGTGSLTKDGSGSVTLNGANTYSGGTNINAGKAIISQMPR